MQVPMTVSERAFGYLKYLVYLALAANVVFFLLEEWSASTQIFRDGVPVGELISSFVATIDTFSWLVLLLLFELETYQLSDDKLTPALTRLLAALRALCYAFIVYACYGYIAKALSFFGFSVTDTLDLCAATTDHLAWMVDLDEFVPVTPENCTVNNGTLLYGAAMDAVVTREDFTSIARLAWIDVINAVTWILVVLNLELDVYMLHRDWLHGTIETISRRSKYLLYLILGVIALYWGVFGDFLDFWDAVLWIFAFFFIEQNIVEWEQELEEQEEEHGHAG